MFGEPSVTIRSIKHLVRHGLFYLLEHALEEAEIDDLDIFDIEHAILTGHVRRPWPRHGTLEIVGKAVDGRIIGVVCRVSNGGKVRVITVYVDRPLT